MEILMFLIPLALLLAAGWGIAFVLAVRKGQFDDLETPKHKIFID